jgi:alkyl hydroperoxide reductase subunit F
VPPPKSARKDAFDVLVVGGGPAGAAAAIYAARKGIRTGIVAERFGGQVMDTLGIENFISVKATEGPKLAMPRWNSTSRNTTCRRDEPATRQPAKLIPASRSRRPDRSATGQRRRAEERSSVILATGARWREMNVPGEKEYKAKGVCFCPHCDGPLFKGKRVAVIGGGNSGVEAAIDLAGIVATSRCSNSPTRCAPTPCLQNKLFSLPNVTVIKSAQTTEVTGDGQKVNGLTLQEPRQWTQITVELEGIFVQIGLLPNTDWLKGTTVNLSRFGEIEIDAKGQTSVPGVFAAGDCTTVPYKQIIIAMGEGAQRLR